MSPAIQTIIRDPSFHVTLLLNCDGNKIRSVLSTHCCHRPVGIGWSLYEYAYGSREKEYGLKLGCKVEGQGGGEYRRGVCIWDT